MKELSDLRRFNGNGKIILLNTSNGRWVRMPEKKYDKCLAHAKSRDNLKRYLEEVYGIFQAGTMPADPKSIYFSVTGSCNLNCKFCAVNAGSQISRESDLTLAEIREQVLPKLDLLKPDKVVITGGEPLVRKDIFDILQMSSDYFGKERIILQTNGTLLDREKVRRLSKYIGMIEISIENVFASNEIYHQMEHVLYEITQCAIPLSLSFVIDEETYKYVKQGINFCQKYNGALSLRMVSLIGRARQNHRNDSMMEEQNILDVYCDILKYFIDKEYFGEKLVGAYLNNLQPRKSCGGFGNILAIRHDGSVYMCGNFDSNSFLLGNIRKDEMGYVLNSLNGKREDPEMQNQFCVDKNKMCAGCDAVYFCTGPCAAEMEGQENMEMCRNKCLLKRTMIQFQMFYYEKDKPIKENLIALYGYLDAVRKQKGKVPT